MSSTAASTTTTVTAIDFEADAFSNGNRASIRFFEVMLILICAALTLLLFWTVKLKMVVLNLFFLPVVLSAFFLGRYRAGVLALFSVLSASIAISADLDGFAGIPNPILIGLAVAVWGAVLGLTSILVGTLSDERQQKVVEIHEAYVGVVEVLSRYLQSANPKLKARSERVAELSQGIARRMKMSAREVDDVRVAALLHDLENIEITTRVIQRAMGSLDEQESTGSATIHGSDLVHSLGGVLTGAMPLLVTQNDGAGICLPGADANSSPEIPLGARIIRTVRAYDAMTSDSFGVSAVTHDEAIDELRRDQLADHDLNVLEILDMIVDDRIVPESSQPVLEPV